MAPESVPGRIRNEDWGTGIRRMVDNMPDPDEEARIAWREFVDKFRKGDFDLPVQSGGQTYIFADRDKIDQFIRRGPHH